jgi:quinoprotein glucose dehydrogenase
VAVDLTTGQRKWHYQLIHHELWDYDNSSAPAADGHRPVGGKPVKAVALPSKQGFLYVFDRETGKPVWPIKEVKVPKGDVPGEWYSPTQPIPTRPAAYARNGVAESDLIDFTPGAARQGAGAGEELQAGADLHPPVVSTAPGPLGVMSYSAQGGTNWPGGSFDPETHIAYLYACNPASAPMGLQKPPAGLSDMNFVVGVAGQPVSMIRGPGDGRGRRRRRRRRGLRPAGGARRRGRLTVDGLPLLKPPYSTISAISLDTGDILWQVPPGRRPDFIRNNPALKGLNIPRTGQPGYQIGTLVTKSLVVRRGRDP